MLIKIPPSALVLLMGAAGAGKSTFAKKWFKPSEVLSSDFCRYLVSGDENDQTATNDAFDLLHLILQRRLRRARLTVVDATNVQRLGRATILTAACAYGAPALAIILDPPEEICLSRNAARVERIVPDHVIREQVAELRRSLSELMAEGLEQIYILKSAEEIDAAVIELG